LARGRVGSGGDETYLGSTSESRCILERMHGLREKRKEIRKNKRKKKKKTSELYLKNRDCQAPTDCISRWEEYHGLSTLYNRLYSCGIR
jgi:hypothetical protein